MKVTEKEKLQNRELIACLYEQYKNYMYSLAVKYAEGHQDCDDIYNEGKQSVYRSTFIGINESEINSILEGVNYENK